MAGRSNVGVTAGIDRLIEVVAQEHQERAPPVADVSKKLDPFEKRNMPHYTFFSQPFQTSGNALRSGMVVNHN